MLLQVTSIDIQSYDSEGITIQGSCEDRKILATTVIPRDSFEHYECKESMVLAVPYHLRKLGGRCISINVLKMDSWRVKNVFKSSNGVLYEAISSYTYRPEEHQKITKSISFDKYSSTKKFLLCEDIPPKGEVEVEVNEGVATFKVDIIRISKFTIGEPEEPYCTIPVEHLKLLNKFLGTTINNPKIEFCKEDQNLLFLVDKEYYRTDFRLTTTKA